MAIFLIVLIFGTACLFHAKIVFYDDHFISCGPTTCESRQYSDISEFGVSSHTRAPIGTIVARQDLYIKYKDRTMWKPFFLLGSDFKQEEVLRLLTEKTGLTVKYVTALPEQ